MIHELKNLSAVTLTPEEEAVLRSKHEKYLIWANKWLIPHALLSFDDWWRSMADNERNMQKDAWEDNDFNEGKL